MSKKPPPNREPKPDDPEQSKRILKTAEEVEADKDPKAFDRVLKSIISTSEAPLVEDSIQNLRKALGVAEKIRVRAPE